MGNVTNLAKFNKLKISLDATYRLRQLKGRTGLNPNILARFAFCHSLKNKKIPDLQSYDTEGMEFNRYTLTGEYDLLMTALLYQRMEKDGLDSENDFEKYFVAHICRGTMDLFPRIKSITDLGSILG